MWGTEYRGPDAATKGAFVDKAVVLCNKEASDTDALEFTETMYRKTRDAPDIHECYTA